MGSKCCFGVCVCGATVKGLRSKGVCCHSQGGRGVKVCGVTVRGGEELRCVVPRSGGRGVKVCGAMVGTQVL